MIQEANGELRGVLVRIGFTSSPNVIVFGPDPALTERTLLSLFEMGTQVVLRLNGAPFTVTERNTLTRGLRKGTDYYGRGIYKGTEHRFYLTNSGGRFIDGYLQPVKRGPKGIILLEERE